MVKSWSYSAPSTFSAVKTLDLRTLPFASLSGAGNMAADEAMLLSAAEHGRASSRTYSWAEPTLTLGYFQEARVRSDDPLIADLAWVRRSTGGATIVHDPATELTYSLALPAGAEWQAKGVSWICRMHEFLRETLETVWGVESKLVVCGAEQKLGPILCFRHQTPGDLLVGGHKIAGSAQRKHKGALLQHGSILLRQSPFAPNLPGLLELTQKAIAPHELAIALARRIAVETGWHLHPGPWTDNELTSAKRIEIEKYGSAAWNEKR